MQHFLFDSQDTRSSKGNIFRCLLNTKTYLTLKKQKCSRSLYRYKIQVQFELPIIQPAAIWASYNTTCWKKFQNLRVHLSESRQRQNLMQECCVSLFNALSGRKENSTSCLSLAAVQISSPVQSRFLPGLSTEEDRSRGGRLSERTRQTSSFKLVLDCCLW